MKRIIIDFKKLTPEVLSLLSEKYPDGYGDNDVIEFKNMHNDTIEAVQVETQKAIYLVKISSKLHQTIVNFDLGEVNDTISKEANTIGEPDFEKDDESE